MTRLFTRSLCATVAFYLTGTFVSPAAPFELKVQKAKIDFDGMLVDHLYFPKGDKDVVMFAQPPSWTMLNEQNAISIRDSKVPTGNIEVSFRGPFQNKDPKALEAEIVSDAIGDLYSEGNADVRFEEVKLNNRPKCPGYSVILTHKKYGKVTTRGVLYFKLTEQDILKIKIGVPLENIEATMKDAKRWVSSFRSETRERLEQMVREGFKP